MQSTFYLLIRSKRLYMLLLPFDTIKFLVYYTFKYLYSLMVFGIFIAEDISSIYLSRIFEHSLTAHHNIDLPARKNSSAVLFLFFPNFDWKKKKNKKENIMIWKQIYNDVIITSYKYYRELDVNVLKGLMEKSIYKQHEPFKLLKLISPVRDKTRKKIFRIRNL